MYYFVTLKVLSKKGKEVIVYVSSNDELAKVIRNLDIAKYAIASINKTKKVYVSVSEVIKRNEGMETGK